MATSMMMRLRFCVVAFTLYGFFQITTSQQLLVVGGDLGWTVPLGGFATYQAWVLLHTFDVGDILLFNFTNGQQDVARVTREAFATCNTTNPIIVNSTNPFNFTLDSDGDYYFTSTLNNHCDRGQKLAIHVPSFEPSPSPSPEPKPRGPRNFTVGGPLGWVIPPGGQVVYSKWAALFTFEVGDALVFLFINGTEDVAVVTKEAYDNCETNNTIAIYSSSPTRIVLNTTGEHYYTSTYKNHCALGQKLAINVTSNSSSSSSSGSGSGSGSAFSPTSAEGPSAGSVSKPEVVRGHVATLFLVAVAFTYSSFF